MKSCQYLISFISECHQEASNASQVNSKFNLYLIMDSMLYRGFLNPMSDERGGGLITSAVWKTSSSSVSFDFCDPKT